MRARARACEQEDFGAYATSVVLVVAMAVTWMLATWPKPHRAIFERAPNSSPVRTLRFWLFEWGQRSVEVEVDATGAERTLIAREFSSPRGLAFRRGEEPRRIVERTLGWDDWTALADGLATADYWSLPAPLTFLHGEPRDWFWFPAKPLPCSMHFGDSGFLMLLAVADSTRSHATDCWGGGPILETGDLLTRLAFLDSPESRQRAHRAWHQ
ncbi:MAG: hypothetical protein FJ091_13400 [Deltaproteobacteria bacterium]|nr:hypothetical protein [Deltaproteobacteria bacterium]